MTSAGFLPSEWHAPPAHLPLPHNEVHVWAVPLNQSSLVLSEMLPWLGLEERTRAAHFHSVRDRNRYIIAHGALREVLGHYLTLAPVDVPLRSLPSGKPVLALEGRSTDLQFNLSHSYQLALVAVDRGRQLGVDVEHIRAGLNGDEIARHFFSPSETAVLRALPQPLRSHAFFTCWTRKEAYLKARGEGLRALLNQFEVVVVPDQPAALVRDEADPRAVRRWSLRSLDVGPEYAAALATEGRDWRLHRWLWDQRIPRR